MSLWYCKTHERLFGPEPFCGPDCLVERVERVIPDPNFETPLEYRNAFEEYLKENE